MSITFPGVFVEEVPGGVHPIEGVSTSETAFVDFFASGPLDEARRITSFAEFESNFGALDASSEAIRYQADLTFMSGHSWPHMGRATGTLMDANAFGTIAAMWTPAFVAVAQTFVAPMSAIVGVGGLALAFVGVYVSGSRTALIALAIGLIPVLFQMWRWWRSSSDQPSSRAKRLLPIAVAIAAIGFVVLVVQGSSTTSIVRVLPS